MVLDFIIKYWIQFAMSGIAGVLMWVMKKLSTRFKHEVELKQKEIEEQALIKAALLALLHDRLYQSMTFHASKDSISIKDLDNLDCLYRGYSSLGGNGLCQELYNRVKKTKKIVE